MFAKLIEGLKSRAVVSWSIMFTMILSVSLMVLGTYIYMNGFHSYDLAQNMRWLDCEFETSLADRTMQGNIIYPEEAYSLGNWQSRIGFLLFGIGSFLFGSSIADGLNMMRGGDEKRCKCNNTSIQRTRKAG